MNVINRNGDKVEFDSTRIFRAIKSAFQACKNEDKNFEVIDDYEIETLVSEIPVWENIHVEQIQDEVEEILMDYGFKEVAREYILYRETHRKLREEKSKLFKQIKSKLEATNVANQNANVDETSFGGRIGESGRLVTKDYALYNCMSEMARNNHLNNEIYIHDLDSYAVGMHNCLTLPIDDLLKNGAVIKNSDLRPAKSVASACQLIAVYFQTQSLEQFGGVACSCIDWSLVPYVRKSFWKYFDKHLFRLTKDDAPSNPEKPILTEQDSTASAEWNQAIDWALEDLKQEIHQGIEALYHNLNSLLSRSGNQLPFSSINYGTCTLPEGQLIIEELLKCSIEGIGKYHRTSIFPCGIFQYMKGINDKPGTPNYYLKKLALESTAKRLYPNYANVDWSVNAGYDRNDPRTYMATMGCRTYNGYDINGFGYLKDGRGNICPVTIIMPTIAMFAVELSRMTRDPNAFDQDYIDSYTIGCFLELLDKKINEAKDMLIERFEYICSQSASSAKFMYQNNTMYGFNPEEGIRSALIHGTLAVG